MQQGQSPEAALARTLLTAHAVRERAHELLALGEADALRHWRVDRAKLESVAAYVVETMRQNYPALDIPFHARWRHFASGGIDRWAKLEATAPWPDASSRARSAFDLAIVSVLLDAGAGPDWRYRGEKGASLSRSEGLAVASFDMFAQGAFSADPREKLRADASRLAAIEASKLARASRFPRRTASWNSRAARRCCARSGARSRRHPASSPRRDDPRPAGSSTILPRWEGADRCSPPHPFWKPCSRISGRSGRRACRSAASRSAIAGGIRAIVRTDATNGLLPFHKLSQWLSYSLIEPLQKAGIKIVDIDGLTRFA